MAFNDIKQHQGVTYSGSPVGLEHSWLYKDGRWKETKISPDEWQFRFSCSKDRKIPAPIGSGAKLGTQYHWFILADQRVTKTSANTYETLMEGAKFKMGHKRPHWRAFSYDYPEQLSYRQRLINILKDALLRLEEEEAIGSVIPEVVIPVENVLI